MSSTSDQQRGGRAWLLLIPSAAIYLAAFFLPLALLAIASFKPSEVAGGVLNGSLTTANYRAFFDDGVTSTIFLSTVRLAAIVTVTCLLLGYPLALFMRRAGPKLRAVLLLIVVSPLLTSVIVRNVAWLLVLGREGLVNVALRNAGLIDAPLPLIYNTFGVVVGVTHVYLSFLVLPVFGSLLAINPAVEESAASLGASPFQVFLRVTLPLTLPGAVAGATLVFILTMGVYLTPVIMGGSFVATLPMVITDLVRNQFEWSKASAFAIILLLFVALIMAVSQQIEQRLPGFQRGKT
jgi:putative spermidine/putrescine transport system permease protein